MSHLDGDGVGGALRVGEQLQSKVMTGLIQCSLEIRGVGRTPDAPLLIKITVSLVDMQPSLSIRSKLRRQALAS